MNFDISLLHFILDEDLNENIHQKILSFFSEFKISSFFYLSYCKNLKSIDSKFFVFFLSDSISLNQLEDYKNSLKFIFIKNEKSDSSYDQKNFFDIVLTEDFVPEQLNFIINDVFQDYLVAVFEKYFDLGIKNLKKLQSCLKGNTNLRTLLGEKNFYDVLISFKVSLSLLENDWRKSKTLNELENILITFFLENFHKAKFTLVTIQKLEKIKPQENNFFSLLWMDDSVLGFILERTQDDEIEVLKFILFYLTIYHIERSRFNLAELQAQESFWTLVLDATPFPAVLLKDGGEIVHHNSFFAHLKIPPSTCLNLEHDTKTMIGDITYHVFRQTFDSSFEKIHLMTFFYQKLQQNFSSSAEVLGIVSSSLAHELNNPIGGILAAIETMIMGDDLEEEEKNLILEMQKGALRCKLLVETFLGFSKVRTDWLFQGELQKVTSMQTQIKISFEQAQNLLRFRCVENGVRFDFSIYSEMSFKKKINPSILTMIFYLIFGELMTLFSHQVLIDESHKNKMIQGGIIEQNNRFVITLKNLNLSSLVLSSFVKNLLMMERLSLDLKDDLLIFQAH